jgi:hypothetical protein
MITWNDFIRNEFKSLLRRPGGMDTLVTKILLFVLVLMIAAYFAVVGYMLPTILKQAKTGFTSLETLNGIMVYYLLSDLFMRLLWQRIPAGIITQYLVLNISRKKIVSFLLTKTFFNIPMAFGFTLWCSFSISQFGISIDGVLWLTIVLLFLLIDSLLITTLKNSFETGLWGTLTTLGIILAIGGTNYFGFIHFNEVIKTFLHSAVYEHQTLILIPLVAVCVLVVYTWKVILSATYKEITATYSFRRATSSIYSNEFFSYWSFEWKQFWRNRRIKTMFFFTTIMFPFLLVTSILNQSGTSGVFQIIQINMLYILIAIPQDSLHRFSFSKESVFFDKLTTVPYSWKEYLKRNYIIGTAVTMLYYLGILIPLFIVSKYRLVLWASIFVMLHLGLTSFLMMYRSTFNKASFLNDTSAWFNSGGAYSAPWYIEGLIFGEMILVPILVALLLLFFSEIVAMVFFSSLGLASLAFCKQWFAMMYRGFMKRRYMMMEGFRTVS